MKQRVDVMVTVHGDKDRAKALTTAAGMTGVSSLTMGGQDKNILTVIGNEVDIVGLTRSLSKKLGNATVVSVMPLNDYRFDREEGAASMRYEGQQNHYGNYSYNYSQPDYYGNYNKYSQPEYCYYNSAVPRYPPPPPPGQYYYLCEEAGDSSCSIM